MTLCETGTRGLIAAAFGPTTAEEGEYARQLTGHLDKDMLVLADRGFDRNALLEDIAARGAQFLVRGKSSRRLPVLALLPDGSYLSRIGRLPVRVIEAEVHARTADGARITGTYLLLTTLTDHRTDPADHLARLYHERWEIESSYLALRHTLLKGRVLRSKDPVGVRQELWGLLALYQALRSVMVTAVETLPGCDPDRAGFTTALEAARDTVIRASGLTADCGPDGRVDLAGRIGAAVLHNLLPPAPPADLSPHRQTRDLPVPHLEPGRTPPQQHSHHRHRRRHRPAHRTHSPNGTWAPVRPLAIRPPGHGERPRPRTNRSGNRQPPRPHRNVLQSPLHPTRPLVPQRLPEPHRTQYLHPCPPDFDTTNHPLTSRHWMITLAS